QRGLDFFSYFGDQQRRLERIGVAVGRLVKRFSGPVTLGRGEPLERAALFGEGCSGTRSRRCRELPANVVFIGLPQTGAGPRVSAIVVEAGRVGDFRRPIGKRARRAVAVRSDLPAYGGGHRLRLGRL